MLYFFRLLLLLININEETLLSWFEIDNLSKTNMLSQIIDPNNVTFRTIKIEPITPLSIETLKLTLVGLLEKVQAGLTLTDIENILFFILFIRFIILAIRYNIKTSFYITCIGLFAGYLWYRHLIDLISMHRSILITLPYLNKLGMDAIQLRSTSQQAVLTDLKLGENVHWYNPGQLIYYAFTKGVRNFDPETGVEYYIDPISMIISKLNQSDQSTILPIYYKIYNKLIPQIFESCSKFWTQLSGIAAYSVITRIGKRYCPYLVRWHWTFLLIIGFIEQILIYFVYRASYFQSVRLIGQGQISENSIEQNFIFQVNFLNDLMAFLICFHLGLIVFGLFHAIWGQYFYFPFFVENTELHIGPRPKNSIYSGGNTIWQDEKEEKIQRVFPKLWYGWFGSGKSKVRNFLQLVTNFITKRMDKVIKMLSNRLDDLF